ncbi:MAG: helicase-associated domain-containing protein [Chloroflexales bacterium]|nr:helicase-associated domain-containing protein [Chloroflexales bacterium]
MTSAALQILPNGQLIVDSKHPQAIAILQSIHSFCLVEAYVGRYVRCRIHRTALWATAERGESADEIIKTLAMASGAAVDDRVQRTIETLMRRWGQVTLTGSAGALCLLIREPPIIARFLHDPSFAEFFDSPTAHGWFINPLLRGALKQAFWRKGWPVDDQASLIDGQTFATTWRNEITLRPYQQAAVTACVAHSHGVVALPPGSGKTYIGVALLAHVQRTTLIITTSRAAANQWRESILTATDCSPDDVAVYRGTAATLAPITITTYQQLIARTSICADADWGLILYDEVHTLPAPVFRSTALLNSRRRYGLSATLIREDGRIGDVFSLIGPLRYSVPWRHLEAQGFIAKARCIEVRVRLTASERATYLAAFSRQQGSLAAHATAKYRVVQRIRERHPNEPMLVIGHYLAQLHALATVTGWSLVTGESDSDERERVFTAFRNGEIPCLILSRVGNQALDLPTARLLVQISGSFGSRQEEAQRLGRVLRPKDDNTALFYSVVSAQTREVEDAWQRQRFLTAQGYTYQVINEDEV